MADNTFQSTVESLFKGMDAFLTTKTVVGEPVYTQDGTVILPLADVSFGVAAGAFAKDADKKHSAGGSMGAKIQPSSVILIKDGNARMVNIKNQDTVTRLLDLVPNLMDKFGKGKDEKKAEDILDEMENAKEEDE